MDLLYAGRKYYIVLDVSLKAHDVPGFPELVDELPPEIGDHIGPEPTLYSNSTIFMSLIDY